MMKMKFHEAFVTFIVLFFSQCTVEVEAFSPETAASRPAYKSFTRKGYPRRIEHNVLSMGVFDSISNFFQERQGDFMKLDEADQEYGPGPALILYNTPRNIDNNEVRDMLIDGAPQASRKGISIKRIEDYDVKENIELLHLSLQEALDTVLLQEDSKARLELGQDANSEISAYGVSRATKYFRCPVLLFSGFSNPEMMASYNIMGKEIYDETMGESMTACAKAVPNAMQKPLSQVLEEISGDHMDAIQVPTQSDDKK